MTTSTRLSSQRVVRADAVTEAAHSARLEGQQVSPATLDDAAAYVDGHIGADEMLRRIQVRYGVV